MDKAEGDGVPVVVDSARVAAYELVTMASIPGAALALARLNVFEALGQAGDGAQLTVAELAAQAMPGKHIDLTNLSRLLRLMCGAKVLSEVATPGQERRYAMTPVGRLLVDDQERGSFLSVLKLQHSPQYLLALDRLHETVLDASIEPHVAAHGMNAWDYFKLHADSGETMNKAMVEMSKISIQEVLNVYHGFDDVRVLVDVGGGFGALLGAITARHPHIKGINFDQPQVIAAAPKVPGVEHVGGSMFESVPSGDAIIMKFVLHGWPDEKCVEILKKCYEALPAHGKVIELDNMVPETIGSSAEADFLALQIDIHMMTWSDFGRERTVRQVRELGLAAGFKQVKLICKVDQMAVIEFLKA